MMSMVWRRPMPTAERRPVRPVSWARGSAVLAAAIAPALLGATAAGAANTSWVLGSSFDPNTTVASYFARYVAPAGDAQMTVRCDTAQGITVDTAVTGGGELPEGVTIGGEAAATVVLTGGGEHPGDLGGTGSVSLRPDGAVLVVLSGDPAHRLADALREPADSAEITIGGVSASLSLAGASDIITTVSKSCPAWSR